MTALMVLPDTEMVPRPDRYNLTPAAEMFMRNIAAGDRSIIKSSSKSNPHKTELARFRVYRAGRTKSLQTAYAYAAPLKAGGGKIARFSVFPVNIRLSDKEFLNVGIATLPALRSTRCSWPPREGVAVPTSKRFFWYRQKG